MPELKELFEQAKSLVDLSDTVARDATVETLKQSWQPLYLALTNLGFGAAQAKHSQAVAALETAKTAAETRADAAERILREAQDKAPDVKTVNEQWETKLVDERNSYAKKEQKLNDRIKNVLTQRDQTQLEALLIERDVPRATARILAKDHDLIPARGDYAEDGSLSVRMAGQQIPFAPGSGQTHLSLLADEVVARSDVKDILVSGGDSGGGVSGREQPGRGDSAFYDKLRKNVKEGATEGIPTTSLRERMKGR